MRRALDVLGAEVGGPAIVIRFRNLGSVVKAKGGLAGAAAYALAPDTITAKAYDETRKKLADGFASQGVDADVRVVSQAPLNGGTRRDLVTGIALGACGVGAGYGLYRLVKYLFFSR